MAAETDFAVPIGEYVEEWLEDNEMSQAELARRMGVSPKHVSKLIHGAAPLTPDVALQLSLVTGIAQEWWLKLESLYRADVSRLSAEHRFAEEHRDLLTEFASAASHLRRRGLLTATMRDPGRLMLELLTFFRVGTPDALRAAVQAPAATFRNSVAHSPIEPSAATWLRLGVHSALESGLGESYDPSAARAAIEAVPKISGTEPSRWVEALEATLRPAGVTLVYVEQVPGCRAYGATQWVQGRPIVQLSLRGKNDGQFWFTLLHELGHVMLHPQVDVTDVDGREGPRELEEEADEFALGLLFPPEVEKRISELNSERDVHALAREFSISPGLIVGQLHRRGQWPYSRGSHLYTRLSLVEDDGED